MTVLPALGPHAAYILGAYAMTALTIALLIVWIVADHRNLQRRISKLEASGVTRRSDRRADRPT